MSIPVIEYVRGLAKASPDVAAFSKFIKAAPGFIDFYYGRQFEDQNCYILAIVWESVEHHLNFTKDLNREKLRETVRLIYEEGPAEVTHILPVYDFPNVFDAPATEFARMTIKEVGNKDRVEQILDAALKEGPGLDANGSTWARSHEKQGERWCIVGWESIEAHNKATKENQKTTELAAQLVALVDIEVFHVEFTKYTA